MSDKEEVAPGSCILVDPKEECVEDDVNTSLDPESKEGAQLTKNQMKKLKARERWLEKRNGKRVEERERRKAKRQAIRDTGDGTSLKRHKGKTMKESTSKVRVCVDMSFDNLMSEKDQKRTVLQLSWCYAANRRAPDPLQYYVTSFSGPSRKMYDSVEHNRNQDIHVHNESLDELFKPEEIIYLTADSDNVLTELDDTKVYVIGGLVDHNSQKGLCYDIAQKKGYGHARLPISEFVDMKSRKVLTINHVYEILVHFSTHKDWKAAFFTVMPQRKGMKDKSEEDEEDEKVINENGENCLVGHVNTDTDS